MVPCGTPDVTLAYFDSYPSTTTLCDLLTFNKAFKIDKAMEAAEKEAKDLQETPSTAVYQLGKVTATKENHRRIPNPAPPNLLKSTDCYRCGAKHKPSHKPTDCKFRDAECNFAKRWDTLPKCAAAKSKACRDENSPTPNTRRRGNSRVLNILYPETDYTPAPILVTL